MLEAPRRNMYLGPDRLEISYESEKWELKDEPYVGLRVFRSPQSLSQVLFIGCHVKVWITLTKGKKVEYVSQLLYIPHFFIQSR